MDPLEKTPYINLSPIPEQKTLNLDKSKNPTLCGGTEQKEAGIFVTR
jgi:hypothetical protein